MKPALKLLADSRPGEFVLATSSQVPQLSDSDLSDSDVTLRFKNLVFSAGVSMRWGKSGKRQRRRKVQIQLRQENPSTGFSLVSEVDQLEDSAYSDEESGPVVRWLSSASVRKRKRPAEVTKIVIDPKRRQLVAPLPGQLDDSDLSDAGLFFPEVKSLLFPAPKKKNEAFSAGQSRLPPTVATRQSANPPMPAPLAPAPLAPVLPVRTPGLPQYVRPVLAVAFTEVLYDPARPADVPPPAAVPAGPSAVWTQPSWWKEDGISDFELTLFRDNFNFSHEDGWHAYHSIRSDLLKLFLYKQDIQVQQGSGEPSLTFNEVRLNFDPDLCDVAVLFKLWKLLKACFLRPSVPAAEHPPAETWPAPKRRKVEIYRGAALLQTVAANPTTASWSDVDPLEFLTLHVREAPGGAAGAAAADFAASPQLCKLLAGLQAAARAAAAMPDFVAPAQLGGSDDAKRHGFVAEEEVRTMFRLREPELPQSLSISTADFFGLVRPLLERVAADQEIVAEVDVVAVKRRLAAEATDAASAEAGIVAEKKAEIAHLLSRRLDIKFAKLDLIDQHIHQTVSIQRVLANAPTRKLSKPLLQSLATTAAPPDCSSVRNIRYNRPTQSASRY